MGGNQFDQNHFTENDPRNSYRPTENGATKDHQIRSASRKDTRFKEELEINISHARSTLQKTL